MIAEREGRAITSAAMGTSTLGACPRGAPGGRVGASGEVVARCGPRVRQSGSIPLTVVPVHLNLTVSDLERSAAFYRRWLNFGPVDRRFPDGTIFLRDPEGTDLALHPGQAPSDPPDYFHFGFRRQSADVVRTLRGELLAADVAVSEFDDEADLVSLKLSDPDGYVVEVYWELSEP